MAYSPDPARGTALALPADRNAALSGNGLAVASMLTWAAGFPAAEVLLHSWPPIALFAARMALALAVMVPIWIWLDGPARVLNARWGRALYIGAVGFGGGMFLILLAQKLTDPVTVAIIASCAPLAATLLEMATGTRRLRWNFALGVLVSIIGGIIATSALAPAQLGVGAACAVVSTFLFCWGSMATARDFPELSQMGRSTITFVGALMMAAVLLLGAYLLGLDLRPSRPVDFAQGAMLVIYALVSMGISQVFFIAAVGKMGVALTSFHINVAPFYVMIIMLVLGEAWDWTRALGAGIVALAVVVAQDRRIPQST